MALPIERWAKQAVLLEREGKQLDPVADMRVLADVGELARLHRHTWRRRQLELVESGVPLNMPEGTYGGLISYPPAATITTTSINGTVNLYPAAAYASLPGNMFLTPQAYRFVMAAKLTNGATTTNIGINPVITAGTWTTGGTALTTTNTLGASTNVAVTTGITNAFYYVYGDVTIRTAGAPGANWTAVGMFHFISTQGTSGGVAGPAAVGTGHNLLFGGTNLSFDGSVAQGISMGAVHSVTTFTHNVEQVHATDWN